jgi:uncharacterized protein (TIGR03435 family)
MRKRFAAVAVLTSGVLFSQTSGAPLSFEVSSVKPASAPITTKDDYSAGYNAGMRAAMAAQGLRISGQHVNVTDNSLKDLIRLAYQVKEYQVLAPAWMATEKYEIAATMPAGTTRSQVPEMMQTLLAERFHLKLHRETRKTPVYALVPAKGGPTVTPLAAGGNDRSWASSVRGHIMIQASTMAAFADQLSKAADRPVVDMTDLTGRYTFELTYTPDLSATVSEAPPPLSTALLEQLGLKLERRETQMEVLVIETADKTPTGN